MLLVAGLVSSAPTTISYQVSASADDGFAYSATGQDISSAYLTIGDDNTYTTPYYMSAMRFTNIDVPRSAVITEAHLKISSVNEGYKGQIYGVIEAEASDSAADFSSRYISAVAKTTASANWDHKDAWIPNTYYASPNISGLIQEIVNRSGWSSGNSAVVFYSTRADSGKSRMFGSFEVGSGFAAVLEVTYETYTISGHITTSEATAVEGVTVSAGSDIEGTVTDASGYYELKVPPGWLGTVAVSKADWGFNPWNKTYSSVTADQLNQDYTAFQPVISGYVKDSSATGIEGVTVSANSGGGSDITDANGFYELTVPYNWSGAVAVSKTDWGFSPWNKTYSSVSSDQLNQDYTAFQPKISGVITSYGEALEGVTLTASNGGGTDVTDSAGNYTIVVPYGWSGAVAPSEPQYTFTPSQRNYSNITADIASQNYTAILPPVSISGYVGDSNGTGIEGVTVTANNGGGLDITDANGFYEVIIPYNWSGAVTPTKIDWGFGPKNRTYRNITYSWQNQNYTVFQPIIYGYIVNLLGIGMLEGVTVTADNGGTSDITDAAGYYKITVPYNWSGTVTPAKTDLGFIPPSNTCSNLTSISTHHSYIAFQPKISGYVRDLDGVGIAGVLVSADNGGGSDTTDFNGYYEITLPYDWSGTITPAKSGWLFTPPNHIYTNFIVDQTNQDFVGFQLKISGFIKDPAGMPIETVSISADSGGGSGVTDTNGFYEINVPHDWSGTVTPTKTDWVFSPIDSNYLNLIVDQNDQDYTAYAPLAISGDIQTGEGIDTATVLVSADNGGGSGVTDANGYYDLTIPYGWSGTITPSKTFWVFDPNERSYVNLTDDQPSQNFTSYPPLTISGYVADACGQDIAGVTIWADNGGGSDNTDANGCYELAVPYGWSGTVAPYSYYYSFEPENHSYTGLVTDIADQDFIRLELWLGRGTKEEPYLIYTAEQLNYVGLHSEYVDRHFKLMADVDMDGYCFKPIGRYSPFTGSFDGNGKKIFNIYPYDGSFFDKIAGTPECEGGEPVEIKNLAFINPHASYAGVLIGDANYVVVTNCYVEDDDSSSGGGGLIGSCNNSKILNCYFSGNVSADGGLIDYCNNSEVTNCYFSGEVSSRWGGVGGLIGVLLSSTVTDCYVEDANVSGGYSTGGLIGISSLDIVTGCYVEDTNIFGEEFVGGLIGSAESSKISNSYATGDVSYSGYEGAGGLIGKTEYSTVTNCYSTGDIADGDTIGGLIGTIWDSTITNCYSTGDIIGHYGIGGLIGRVWHSTITNCYSAGAVSADDYSGGFVGGELNDDIYTKCFWNNTVNPTLTGLGNGFDDPNVIGISTTQMQTKSTFTDVGWDFLDETTNGTADIWRLCEDGTDYPRMRWQFNLLGDFVCYDGVDAYDLVVLADEWLLREFAVDADFDKDGVITFLDWAVFANAWQSDPASSNWDPRCDLFPEGGDSLIDIEDVAVFLELWLEVGAYYLRADIASARSEDGVVNMLDFAVLANNWLGKE